MAEYEQQSGVHQSSGCQTSAFLSHYTLSILGLSAVTDLDFVFPPTKMHCSSLGNKMRDPQFQMSYQSYLVPLKSLACIWAYCSTLAYNYAKTQGTNLWSSSFPWPCSSPDRRQSHISDRPSGCWRVLPRRHHTSLSPPSLLASMPAWLKKQTKQVRNRQYVSSGGSHLERLYKHYSSPSLAIIYYVIPRNWDFSQNVRHLSRHLTILLDPWGCSVLSEDHLTEFVPDEAKNVLGCGLVQLALLQHPRDPQGQGLIIKLVWSGEAIHPNHPVFTIGKPGMDNTGFAKPQVLFTKNYKSKEPWHVPSDQCFCPKHLQTWFLVWTVPS